MTGAAIAVLGGKKLAGALANNFGTKVIERWTRYRAQQFFESFIQTVAAELHTGVESAECDKALHAILDDEAKSEALWEAYRAVCLAKSKTLGPKIIGILIGYIVAEGRVATATEEKILAAAEAMSDGEIVGLFKEFSEWAAGADSCKNPKKEAHWDGNVLVVPWHEERRDSAWKGSRESEIEVSQLNLGEAFGNSWALKAEGLGLLSSRMTQREVEYQEDSERHIDQDGVLTIYATTITFEAPCRRFCELVERCLGAAQAEANPS